MLATLGCTILVNQCDRRFDQALGVLPRVGDGGGGGDKLGSAAVEVTDTPQTSDHIPHVRAEDAAIGVHLIQHHPAQAGEESGPVGVVGENAHVEHVGVGEHDASVASDLSSDPRGGIAVVGVGPDLRACSVQPAIQLIQLIVGQSLGGEEVEGRAAWVADQGVEEGESVAEGLP